jgi:chromosome segregation ATPase
MAKIDVTKIEGFEDMTPDEKIAALTAFEFDIPQPNNAELDRYKAAVSKANSEAASYKQQLREKQTEAERLEAERQESERQMREELETLRKEKAVAATTAKITPLIGDSEVAGQIAEYLYGAEDVDAALTALQKAWTAKEKALRLEFGKIPAPGAGASDGPTITREQLDGMKFPERVKFMNEHRDEYEKLMGR